MPLSQSDLRLMVAAASTIPERISSHFLPDDGQKNDEIVQARLSGWCRVSTAGGWQLFQERLSWDGLDLSGAQRLLAPGLWSEQVPLPAWTTTLQQALRLVETTPGESVSGEKGPWPFLDASKPLPFEALLAPFVALARQRFFEKADSATYLLTDAAHLTLQRHLLQVLTSLSVNTLHAEFTQRRAEMQAAGGSTQNDEVDVYQRFLRQMGQGGLAHLLRSYSVLARLLATTCDLWVEANSEFAQRLAADWSDLEPLFSSGVALGQVSEIELLSDVHAGRRCVMALTFASGDKIVYKPRSVGMEEGFAHLLSWCNEQGATPPFKVLAILNRVTYGWVEYVAYAPCQDGEALRRYYQRAGMLLCLIYLLGGRNCLYDQLIAHGEHPVLVDASHLLQPYLSPNPQPPQGEDWEQALYSILHTGLLATWNMPPSRHEPSSRKARIYATDISGFGLDQGHQSTTPEGGQERQSMILKYGLFKPRASLNSAADDVDLPVEEELHEGLCRGLQHMYQILLRQRAALLAADSPLQRLNTQVVRVIYRDHAVYDDLMPKLLAPQALRDAVTRSMLLESLGQSCVPAEWFWMGKRDQAHWWQVFAVEREALLQGTTPVMSAHSDSNALLIDLHQKVASCLYQPSFDLLLRRLKQLSEEDMYRQLFLLQEALPRKSASVVSRVNTSEAANDEAPNSLPLPASNANVFLTNTLAIADELARHAVEIGQESVVWVNAEASLRLQNYQLRPMDYGFSHGASGTAFFLAALARQTGIARYRGLALAALRPLRSLLKAEKERLAYAMGLGAGPGLGSLVYALTRISQFLDEPELLADARAVACLITPERIADDRLLDVFLGTAGAMLGLLALYERSQEQDVLDRAVLCGQHLLRARTLGKTSYHAWPTLFGEQTTGFAHGAAGIVYALLRLYAVTGDMALIEAAQEGLHFEDRTLLRHVGNWMEMVGGDEAECGISWCHGAPGIGLARLGGLPMLDTPTIRRDIDIALQTTQRIGSMGVDYLCCGTSGRAEFLLAAAQRLERPELAHVAADWLRQVLARAEERGALLLNASLPRWVTQLHLFQGASGIGYTLLRLTQPDALPSLLLWE